MRSREWLRSLVVGLVCLGVTEVAAAQEQFTRLEGSVVESGGAPVPGAVVRLEGPGDVREAAADAAGHFAFPRLLPGTHTLRVLVDGRELARAAVELTLGPAVRVEIHLPPHFAESVDVDESAGLATRQAAGYASSLSRAQIEALPHGRDFTDLLPLLPGVRREALAGGFQFDGASGSEAVYLFDGVETTDPVTGVAGQQLPATFVENLQVKVAGFEAEYGGALGGVVNLVTRTGGDDWHGGAGITYGASGLDGRVRPTLTRDATGNGVHDVRYPKDATRELEPELEGSGPLLPGRAWLFAAVAPREDRTRRRVHFIDGTTRSFETSTTTRFFDATLTAAPRPDLLLKLAAHTSPSRLEGSLPGLDGHGSSNPAGYASGEERDAESYGFVADTQAAADWSVELRAGRFRTDHRSTGLAKGPPVKGFESSTPAIFPDVPSDLVRPAGFSTGTTFPLWTRDLFRRTSYGGDASHRFQALGEHEVKLGAEGERTENDVLRDTSSTSLIFQWGRGDDILGNAAKGTYGALAVERFQAAGDVASRRRAYFVQDTWRPRADLTLRLGLRAETETIPDYRFGHEGGKAVAFGLGDELAPRLGFSWDPGTHGRSSLFGSWGRFYDATKLELARTSFGSERRIRYVYKLQGYDWPSITCEVTVNDPSARPDCGPEAAFVSAVDLRVPSNDAIDPAIRPTQSEEWQLGYERLMGRGARLGARLVHKRLVRVIEDIGAFVPGVGEVYVIGNPGEGRSSYAQPGVPLPKPRRVYDALELTYRSDPGRAWTLDAAYTYSRLRGNFPGLASSDEGGRTAPNIERAYDGWFTPFGASGKPIYGPLGTDRPHELELSLTGRLPGGVSLSLFQYAASGTPRTTRATLDGVYFFPYGRGDLGRNPTLTQTDLRLADVWPIGRFSVELAATVLNVFDQATPTGVAVDLHSGSITISDAAFLAGFDLPSLLATEGIAVAPGYAKVTTYQAPRSVLLSLTFRL